MSASPLRASRARAMYSARAGIRKRTVRMPSSSSPAGSTSAVSSIAASPPSRRFEVLNPPISTSSGRALSRSRGPMFNRRQGRSPSAAVVTRAFPRGNAPPGSRPKLNCVTAASPVPERRRSRPGSLERPVNARLYRGTWLLVGLPLLLLAFSVAQPSALQTPDLPPAFDAATAASLATDLATSYPDRTPGTPGAKGAPAWFRRQLKPYGFDVRSERFRTTIKGKRTTLVDLVTEKTGIGVS